MSLPPVSPMQPSPPPPPPPPAPVGAGFFGGARDFMVKDTTFIAYNINQNDSNNNSNKNSNSDFKFKSHLSKHILYGAEFDSSARHPPPTCHPGTRATLLDDITSWRFGNSFKIAQLGRMLWLNGVAGVGKSSIIQTLATHEARLQPQSLLGATIFFSRPNKRDNAQLVFNTIAYRLGVSNPGYQDYVWDKIAKDPTLPLKSLSEQFYWYIEIPFGQQHLSPAPPNQSLSIYLDGLDECKGHQAQEEVIRLIGEFTQRYPHAPLLWIISSRDEPHIRVAFQRLREEVDYWELEIPTAAPTSLEDVKKVLHYRFERIRETYETHMPERSSWPSRTQFLKVAKYSNGMFAFADTVIRFVDDPEIGDPVSQLEKVITSLDQTDAWGLKIGHGTTPDTFTALDRLYTDILSDIHESVWPTARRLLAVSLNGDRYSMTFVCNLLGIKQNEGYGALRKLHSLINIPQLEASHTQNLHFYHASFSDYLQDPTRSGRFCITQQMADSVVWECWFRILREVDESGINGVGLTWSEDDPQLDGRLRQDIYEDTRNCWANELSDRCEDVFTGEQLPVPPLVVEAVNAVNYGDLGPWMPTGEMRQFLRYVKELAHRTRDVPVRKIATCELDFAAIGLGHMAYALCEAFGDIRPRDEFIEWEKEPHRGYCANAALKGPARFGTAYWGMTRCRRYGTIYMRIGIPRLKRSSSELVNAVACL
ncbi:hypothetical protein P691DRAFT_787900 [Macrolepiota fuliginosa MF-IS2]|uniref:Nephrocystin 3-like N-terminal domain-containing protein n=1 Tax=Macrolepiota fuliginosa MF-IS2 TaxID=1400762 RepID=A0A9P5XGR3_9AGAR|nr:hypothetical protein P691DRAFT_787900 [Macrolepiota fuliginosa MF-IS2]